VADVPDPGVQEYVNGEVPPITFGIILEQAPAQIEFPVTVTVGPQGVITPVMVTVSIQVFGHGLAASVTVTI